MKMVDLLILRALFAFKRKTEKWLECRNCKLVLKILLFCAKNRIDGGNIRKAWMCIETSTCFMPIKGAVCSGVLFDQEVSCQEKNSSVQIGAQERL